MATALTRKSKGDLAELKVAADLVARGHRVAMPYGEDSDFDLISAEASAWSEFRSSTCVRMGRYWLSVASRTP